MQTSVISLIALNIQKHFEERKSVINNQFVLMTDCRTAIAFTAAKIDCQVNPRDDHFLSEQFIIALTSRER